MIIRSESKLLLHILMFGILFKKNIRLPGINLAQEIQKTLDLFLQKILWN